MFEGSCAWGTGGLMILEDGGESHLLYIIMACGQVCLQGHVSPTGLVELLTPFHLGQVGRIDRIRGT